MALTVDGATRLYLVIGDPIAQVRSPAGISVAFRQRGANALVVPAHVTTDDVDAVLTAIKRIGNIDGVIATIPHKFALARHADRLTRRVTVLGAANLIRKEPDGRWLGDMSDGLGFVAAIRKAGGDPAGRRALLIGAGGAGSAIGLALLEAGARELAIHDADAARRDALIARLSSVAKVPIRAGTPDPTGFDLVANATPAGMGPDDAPPVMLDRLTRSMAVGCVVTLDSPTPFIQAARDRGCAASTGTDMYHAQVDLIAEFLLGVGVGT